MMYIPRSPASQKLLFNYYSGVSGGDFLRSYLDLERENVHRNVRHLPLMATPRTADEA